MKYSGGLSALGILFEDEVVVAGLEVGRIRGSLAMRGEGDEEILEWILFVGG